MTEKDVYDELTKATPEELLDAALWFYRDYEHGCWLLRLGFKLAQPGGWENIAPRWLRMSKELDDKSNLEE